MHNDLLTQICTQYELGHCLTKPSLCAGGRLNQVWKIRTSTGFYVIKILNPAVIHLPEQFENYRIREVITSRLQDTVSLVCAIKNNQDDVLYNLHDNVIMVFPYIEGHPITQAEIHSIHSKTLGKALAKIHTKNVKLSNAPAVNVYQPNTLNDIKQLIRHQAFQALNIDIVFLETLCEQYKIYLPILSSHLIISHRDCDTKNVLWDNNNQYYIIDWESAGLINKTHDTLATALYWSLSQAHQLNTNLFHEFIHAYINHNGSLNQKEIEAGLFGLLGDWLGWLDFNFQRMTKNPIEDTEFELGRNEAKLTMQALPILYNQFSNIINLLK